MAKARLSSTLRSLMDQTTVFESLLLFESSDINSNHAPQYPKRISLSLLVNSPTYHGCSTFALESLSCQSLSGFMKNLSSCSHVLSYFLYSFWVLFPINQRHNAPRISTALPHWRSRYLECHCQFTIWRVENDHLIFLLTVLGCLHYCLAYGLTIPESSKSSLHEA